jgi:hypothetical protein
MRMSIYKIMSAIAGVLTAHFGARNKLGSSPAKVSLTANSQFQQLKDPSTVLHNGSTAEPGPVFPGPGRVDRSNQLLNCSNRCCAVSIGFKVRRLRP